MNGSVQSPANSVTVRALNEVDALLEKRIDDGMMTEKEAFLILTVHDSGAWEVKDEHVDWFVPNLKEIAEKPVEQLSGHKFKMNVGVGHSWTEAELNAG